MAIYKGFNTVGKVKPPWGDTDINIVKQDLYNHFMTRKGERVMLPEFGSVTHDYLFDPLDDLTRNDIIEDSRSIIAQDPRVELITIQVDEFDNGIRIDMELLFVPQDTADHLVIDFERNLLTGF